MNRHVCFMILLMMSIVSFQSCSKKVTDINDDITISSSKNIVSTDSSYYAFSQSRLEKIMSDTETWWNATYNKKVYDYDSLGNQIVTSEETIDITGGSNSKDSSCVSYNADAEIIITHSDTIKDTLYIRQKYTKTITKDIPFMTKITSALGWILIAILFLLLIIFVFKHLKLGS